LSVRPVLFSNLKSKHPAKAVLRRGVRFGQG
jgi:hypothetical protein